jgi:predicted nucleotidyltransferase
MKTQITHKILELESKYQITVLYACESGSRAWGFPSPDSDFDVRCIYSHPMNWYLSVLEKKDQFVEPISGDLDISGWELKKALSLISKSNCVVWEWLQSPTVYLQQEDFSRQLLQVAAQFFSPITGFHHYFSMATRGIEERSDSPRIKVKKYFYILRPLLAATWICQNGTTPPMTLLELLHLEGISPNERQIIENLVRQKLTLGEKHEIDPILEVEALIDRLAKLCQIKGQVLPATKGNLSNLDQFLQSWIR